MSKRLFTHLSTVDPVLGGVIAATPRARRFALKPKPEFVPFEALAEAITYQQLNGIAAATIFKRFVLAAGTDGAFPTPQQVLATADSALRGAGLSFAKMAAIRDLAVKTIEGVVPDRATLESLDNDAIVERLTQVRGIGRWTVEMLLMFQLARPDVLPVDDFGVRNGFRLAYGLRKMPSPKALALYGERWAPYRTAAAWYLWRACELARDGTLPKPSVKTRMPRVPRLRRAVKRLKKALQKRLRG